VLVAQVLVAPAIRAILGSPSNVVRGFLAAGHVCTITGMEDYRSIAEQYRVPIVATGFEPLDLLRGILMCVEQLEQGRHEAAIQYRRSVRAQGNPAARRQVDEVFRPAAQKWRGIGEIPKSGLVLRDAYAEFDAASRFELPPITAVEPAECIAGEILQGHKRPRECPAFGTGCTPDRPYGAPMVSAEGACAAYYRYRRRRAGASN